jgi:hypothetical protein
MNLLKSLSVSSKFIGAFGIIILLTAQSLILCDL